MIDSDNDGFGLNMYNQKIEDPQATNAVNTSIYSELLIIQKLNSKTPEISNLINKILKLEPLHPSISALRPFEFY